MNRRSLLKKLWMAPAAVVAAKAISKIEAPVRAAPIMPVPASAETVLTITPEMAHGLNQQIVPLNIPANNIFPKPWEPPSPEYWYDLRRLEYERQRYEYERMNSGFEWSMTRSSAIWST